VLQCFVPFTEAVIQPNLELASGLKSNVFSGHSDLGPAAFLIFLGVDLNNPSPEKHAWKNALAAQKNDPSKRQQ
jgi:hypothetical protein